MTQRTGTPTPRPHDTAGSTRDPVGARGAATTVQVAVCQLAPVVGDLSGNRERALAAAEQAIADGARLVVLPELVTAGYVFESAQEARSVAEPADGETVRAFADLSSARAAVVVAGYAELGPDGLVYNSAFVVQPAAPAVTYRKVHLWDREPDFFTPGSAPPPVVPTPLGRVGVVICYDLEFPEWTRTVALAGADILCGPTNWPASHHPDGERPIEVVRAQSTASVNRIFVAACDRTGVERDVDWVGGSVIVGPDGYPLTEVAGAGAVRTLHADCALAEARDKATGPRNDVFADRRLQLYADAPAGRGSAPEIRGPGSRDL